MAGGALKLYDIPTPLKDDAMTLLCGDLIGCGVSRQVYECKFNSKFVVKVELDGDGRFQNQREWFIWNQFKEAPKDRIWLAPCYAISDLGKWLIMERTTPASIHELRRLAPRVPKFLTDLKQGNWGLLNGAKQVVCHDYGTALIETHNGTKRAEWWE